MAATKGLKRPKKTENDKVSEDEEKLGGKDYERELAKTRWVAPSCTTSGARRKYRELGLADQTDGA
jgi:hypothetical protein